MSETNKFKLLTFIRYLGDSFFYPFLSLYLNTFTFGEAKIGFLISLVPIISMICNPIYSKLCKNSIILKRMLSLITIIEGLFILLIGYSSSYYLVLIFIILISISGCSHYGLLDSLTTIYSKNNNINFSSIRIFGSAAYAFGTFLSGVIAEKFSYSFCFIISFVLFFITGLIYLWVKPVYDEKKNEIEEKRSYKEVFRNKKCLLYIMFYVLVYGLIKGGTHFFSLLLNSRGLGSDIFGFVYSGVVVVELITMLLCIKFDKKMNYKVAFLISIISLVITNFISSTNLPSIVIILCYAFRGISVAIAFHLNYKTLVYLAGLKNITIVCLLEELLLNIFFALVDFFGGRVIEYVSYNMFYFILAMVALFGTLYYLFIVRKFVAKNNNELENIN